MMQLLGLLLVLLLLSGCQRYTIGAANSAPRVVSGNVEMAETDDHTSTAETHAEETHAQETVASTDHSADMASSEEATHAEEAGHSEATAQPDAEHSQETHSSVSIPELDSALVVVQESFAHVRGSTAVRHEAAESLETARAALHTVAETGAISHWEDLDHYFETAIEKVAEGTNDAPNALNRLLAKLEKADKH
jgi:hypothetical protein